LCNWGAHAANLVVMFFLSPFLVHTLGRMEYGIWSLLWVLTGYMGVLDLGVRASTGRHVILYLGKEDHEKVDHTIRTGLGFFTLTGGLVVAIGSLIGWVFPSAFSSVPTEYHGLVKVLLPVMALNVWLSALAAVFSSVIVAHERFDIARGIDLAVLAIRTVGTVFALKWGYGILGLTVVVVVCNLVGLLANWAVARRIYRRLRAWPLMLSKQRARELLGYGIAAFISAIAVKIIGQTSLVVVGAAINVSAVTVFSVGAMLIYYSSTFLDHIGSTFFPPVQRAAARSELGTMRWLFLRQVRLGMILGLVLNVGFIVFARPFIRLWMLGPEFPESAVSEAAMVMAILAGSKLLLLPTIGSNELLAATGHIWFTATISIIEAGVNLGLSISFVLVLRWGLAGVAAGTLVARVLVRTFVLPWYACRRAGISWPGFCVRIGGPGILSGALFAAVCLAIRAMVRTDSWPVFGISILLALVCYAPIASLILVPSADRKRVYRELARRARRETPYAQRR
jgi:O-antigen/teichoic acid export membrane protein